ncbi:MAG: hypothetical protein LBP58_08245 [Azoarcus sp.]|jgi:hypothetical protein|nr:hypothetical protein [Azoarcus sp.]
MTDGPHPLTIRLRPHPVLLAAILAAHFAVGLALFLMHLPLALTASTVLAVLASAVLAVRAQARKRGLALVLAADGALRISHESDGGGDTWAKVLPGAVVFPAVVWFALGWTGQDERSHRLRLMLIAAEVEEAQRDRERGDPAQWRRLRTWLRHRAGRPAQGSSRSGG